MRKTVPVIVGVLLLGVLVLFNTTYTVDFHEVAIKTRFGKAQGVERNAGLHVKAPFFIDRVTKIDDRLQLVDSPLETVQTKDGQQVMAQSFLLWRLAQEDAGVLSFFENYGSVEEAGKSLEGMLQSSLRVLGGFDFSELIGAGNKLGDAETRVLDELKRTLPPGIDAVTVGLSQITLPPKSAQAVIRRMEATQQRLAETERSRGNAEAQLVQGRAATEAEKIRTFAKERASAIEAEGTRAAAKYLEQMREGQELAIFLAWCDTLRASLGGESTIYLDTTRPPFHMMRLDARTDANGIPLPEAGYDAPSAPAGPLAPAAKPTPAQVPAAGSKPAVGGGTR